MNSAWTFQYYVFLPQHILWTSYCVSSKESKLFYSPHCVPFTLKALKIKSSIKSILQMRFKIFNWMFPFIHALSFPGYRPTGMQLEIFNIAKILGELFSILRVIQI